MRITVTMTDESLATVTFTPSLLDRILGEKIEERNAVRCHDINGGYCWLWDSNGRRVPNTVLAEIELAIVTGEWDKIWNSKSVEVAER